MEELFDFLAKKGYLDEQRIESAFMQDLSFNDIINFNEQLCEKIPEHPVGTSETTSFEFIANSALSAQTQGECTEWDCRVRRIDNLSRFAALYSDRIYVCNYFEHYPTEYLKKRKIEKLLENKIRRYYVGDLKVLLSLKPLLESGIISILNSPHLHLCPTCLSEHFPKLRASVNKLQEIIPSLVQEYTRRSSAEVLIDQVNIDERYFGMYLKVPEDLAEHGGIASLRCPIPNWLLPKLQVAVNSQSASKLKLSNKELIKLKYVDRRVEEIISDVLFHQFCSRVLNLNGKYLTNRDIDVSLITSLTSDETILRNNDILRRHLIYQIPTLHNVPINLLLEIRKNEHDAFLVYRNTINHIINDYILKKRTISEQDAKQIYADIIYPRLCELNVKINSIKSSARKKLARNASVITTVVTIGMFSGILPTEIQPLIAGLGGLSITKDVIDLIAKSVGVPEEVRNDNFYFLWKLSKKHKGNKPVISR